MQVQVCVTMYQRLRLGEENNCIQSKDHGTVEKNCYSSFSLHSEADSPQCTERMSMSRDQLGRCKNAHTIAALLMCKESHGKLQ